MMAREDFEDDGEKTGEESRHEHHILNARNPSEAQAPRSKSAALLHNSAPRTDDELGQKGFRRGLQLKLSEMKLAILSIDHSTLIHTNTHTHTQLSSMFYAAETYLRSLVKFMESMTPDQGICPNLPF